MAIELELVDQSGGRILPPRALRPAALRIGGPSKMTFGASNLLLFFLAEGYMINKGVLDSTRPWLHNGLRKIKKN